MNEHLKALGDALRRIRKARHICQMDLAELADLHRTYICDVERGTRNITFLTLLRLARSLEVPIWEVVWLAETRWPLSLDTVTTPIVHPTLPTVFENAISLPRPPFVGTGRPRN